MKSFKPGELWAKHQEKMKKKHEKHMKHHKTVSNNSASMSLPNSMSANKFLPKYSPMKNSNSTTEMAKPMLKKHAKHRKHVKKHEKHEKKLPSLTTKHSGKFEGKSNALGHGGRAAQLKARGVPGGVIGMMARAAHAAPGQANYHPHKKHRKEHSGEAIKGMEKFVHEESKEKKHMKHRKHMKHEKATMHCKMCGHVHE